MAPEAEPRVIPSGPAIAPTEAPTWPPASAALIPRAIPPTAPTAAVIFIAVLKDAIWGDWQRGHCNDMVLSSMVDVISVMYDCNFFNRRPSQLLFPLLIAGIAAFVGDYGEFFTKNPSCSSFVKSTACFVFRL